MSAEGASDEPEILYEMDRERESLFGHSIQNVLLDTGLISYHCDDCDRMSRSIAFFDQFGCEGGDSA